MNNCKISEDYKNKKLLKIAELYSRIICKSFKKTIALNKPLWYN